MADRSLTVVAAVPGPVEVSPGSIVALAEGLLLGVADGSILVTRLKPEGRAEMDAAGVGTRGASS